MDYIDTYLTGAAKAKMGINAPRENINYVYMMLSHNNTRLSYSNKSKIQMMTSVLFV